MEELINKIQNSGFNRESAEQMIEEVIEFLSNNIDENNYDLEYYTNLITEVLGYEFEIEWTALILDEVF